MDFVLPDDRESQVGSIGTLWVSNSGLPSNAAIELPSLFYPVPGYCCLASCCL